LPDAVYRLHPQSHEPLYTSDEDIFGAVDAAEEPLIEDLAQFFTSLPAARRVVGPLAIGNHVDHQLARAASERVWGPALLYYEDYPYVQRDPSALDRLLEPATLWRSYLVTLGHAALQARIEATSLYRSQLGSLFNSAEQMEVAIARQVARMGGERLWQQVRARCRASE
jgi:hypothetical protein